MLLLYYAPAVLCWFSGPWTKRQWLNEESMSHIQEEEKKSKYHVGNNTSHVSSGKETIDFSEDQA
jgi:hypothetical protein